jgi:archaellum component FlaC
MNNEKLDLILVRLNELQEDFGEMKTQVSKINDNLCKRIAWVESGVSNLDTRMSAIEAKVLN